MAPEAVLPVARAAFEAARRRRVLLAALSPEEKLVVLVELQRLASAVVQASGRAPRQPWRLPAVQDHSRQPADSGRNQAVAD